LGLFPSLDNLLFLNRHGVISIRSQSCRRCQAAHPHNSAGAFDYRPETPIVRRKFPTQPPSLKKLLQLPWRTGVGGKELVAGAPVPDLKLIGKESAIQ
jgi:hypothetical protein